MSERPDDLDEALEQVITAARAHLAAVRAAGGALDDREVWQRYVTLNNLSVAYDQLLLDEFGEATPWETELIDTSRTGDVEPGSRQAAPADPYPAVLAVRQRRDYRVPSTTALMAAAAEAASRMGLDGQPPPAPETVGEAVLTLVQYGDGSLAGLDLPELEPLGGVVTVSAHAAPLELSTGGGAAGLFAVGAQEEMLGRLDEQPDLEPPAEPVDDAAAESDSAQ